MNKPELPYLENYQYAILVGILCVPFFISPFPIFYPFFTLAFCAFSLLYNYWHKPHYEDIAEFYLPADVTPYQVAAFLYGKNRAIQVGIINLMNRDLMALEGSKKYILKKAGYVPLTEDPNPLIEGWEQAAPEKEYNYFLVRKKWYAAKKMQHTQLEIINQFLFSPRKSWLKMPLWIIMITGFVAIPGSEGPIGGIEWFISTIAISIAIDAKSARQIIFKKAIEKWTTDDLLFQYAIKGPDTISKFRDGERLTASFYGEINTGFRYGKSENLRSD